MGLVRGTFIALESKLVMYKMHVDPIFNYYTILHSNMGQSDRLENEDGSLILTKRPLGHSLSINYMECCTNYTSIPFGCIEFKITSP